jgi:hypothetical protein
MASPASYDVVALQNAVWNIEGEAYTSSLNMQSLIADATANATDADLLKVGVMNLWENSDATGAAQSYVYQVPVPGAFLLGAVGLGMVGWIKRRKQEA